MTVVENSTKRKKKWTLLSEISWKKNDHVIGFLSSRFQVRKKMNMHLEDKVATSNKIEIIQSITHSNNIFSRLINRDHLLGL